MNFRWKFETSEVQKYFFDVEVWEKQSSNSYYGSKGFGSRIWTDENLDFLTGKICMFNYDVWAFVHFKLKRKITADSRFVILLLF